MLEITSHRNGELLSARHGKESPDELTIQLRGIASIQSKVTVNGMAETGQRVFSRSATQGKDQPGDGSCQR